MEIEFILYALCLMCLRCTECPRALRRMHEMTTIKWDPTEKVEANRIQTSAWAGAQPDLPMRTKGRIRASGVSAQREIFLGQRSSVLMLMNVCHARCFTNALFQHCHYPDEETMLRRSHWHQIGPTTQTPLLSALLWMLVVGVQTPAQAAINCAILGKTGNGVKLLLPP